LCTAAFAIELPLVFLFALALTWVNNSARNLSFNM
jgi:hypothetical protein